MKRLEMGGSGMVGGCALRYALQNPNIELVTSVGRRNLGHTIEFARVLRLLAAGFPRVYIFRPAYIYPVEPRREPTLGYAA